MSENLQNLMERFYKVPVPTANEKKLYELAGALRQEMTETQAVTLDVLMETCMDCIGDAAEDAFEQGFFVCLRTVKEDEMREIITI